MFLQRFVALFMIEILPRVLNMYCTWPKLAFCSEIPLFYSFERWSKYLRLGNRWKIDTLVLQFYGCFALQVFESVTWLKTINWLGAMMDIEMLFIFHFKQYRWLVMVMQNLWTQLCVSDNKSPKTMHGGLLWCCPPHRPHATLKNIF